MFTSDGPLVAGRHERREGCLPARQLERSHHAGQPPGRRRADPRRQPGTLGLGQRRPRRVRDRRGAGAGGHERPDRRLRPHDQHRHHRAGEHQARRLTDLRRHADRHPPRDVERRRTRGAARHLPAGVRPRVPPRPDGEHDHVALRARARRVCSAATASGWSATTSARADRARSRPASSPSTCATARADRRRTAASRRTTSRPTPATSWADAFGVYPTFECTTAPTGIVRWDRTTKQLQPVGLETTNTSRRHDLEQRPLRRGARRRRDPPGQGPPDRRDPGRRPRLPGSARVDGDQSGRRSAGTAATSSSAPRRCSTADDDGVSSDALHPLRDRAERHLVDTDVRWPAVRRTSPSGSTAPSSCPRRR